MIKTSRQITGDWKNRIVASINKLLELDFNLSKKIASYLDYDGYTRKFFQVITLTGTAIVWLIALPIAFFYLSDFRIQAYSMFAVTAMMTLIVYLIKLTVKRPRPEFKDDRFLSVSFDVFSFPSGHATRAAYVAILMPVYTPELALFWYIWSFIMIVSRLVLGVHYISDIIAGLIFGSFVMLLLFLVGWLPEFPLSHLL